MMRIVAIGVAAGALSASLLLLVLMGSFGGVILAYLAPLPLFYAGLAYGMPAALIAGLAGTAASALVGLLAGLSYLVAFAAPVVILVRQALLSRSAPDGTIEWYPPGLLVAWLSATAAAVFLIAALAAGARDGMPDLLKPALVEMLREMNPGGEPGAIEAAAERLARLLPTLTAMSWMLMMVVNGALAQGLAARFGRNLRPSPDMAALELPAVMLGALGGGVVLAFLPDPLGYVGLTIAAIAGMAFFLQGLAVIHFLARRARTPGAIVAAAYAALVLFGGLVAVVAVLGLVEQAMGLRRRIAGRAGPSGG
jgi:uncharacterized protein YybS (DUF2232 family)